MRTVEEIQADERLWTVADVAHYLSCSRSLVYQKAASGEIPTCRPGGGNMLRFDPDAIKAWARGETMPAQVVSISGRRP